MKSLETDSSVPCLRRQEPFAAIALAVALFLVLPSRSRSEDQISALVERYREDNDRVTVETLGGFVEKKLTDSTLVRMRYIYDAISGASPKGLPPPPGSDQVPLEELRDYRNAISAGIDQKLGSHTLAPQFAHSEERDYESYSIAYAHSVEFNQKNTTVTLGASHDFDRVLDASFDRMWQDKDTTDVLLGFNQLLGPGTILAGTFTFGYTTGYLDDPYKRVAFDSYDPSGAAGFREQRPGHKARQFALVSLTQFIAPANASVEVSYRFHNDTYGIQAHTATLAWNQKIGRHVILSPILRFHSQNAADFYFHRVDASLGDPIVREAGFPSYYSGDYRLSALESWTFGVTAKVLLGEHVRVELAYKRYEMSGTDGVTSQSAYPSAHVFSGGLSWLF